MFKNSNSKISLVEMERKLMDDKSGVYRRSIMEDLNNLDGKISKIISQGLDKETFDLYNQVKIAILSAKKVINTVSKG